MKNSEIPVPQDLLAQVVSSLRSLEATVEAQVAGWMQCRSAETFRAMENEVARLFREGADAAVGLLLKSMAADPSFQAEATAAARAALPLRSAERRTTKVRLLGGGEVELSAEYLRPDPRRQPGRKRRDGKRGKGGRGVYPLLSALGITFGVTPAAAAEITRQVADSDSVRTGRAALARRGLDLGHKQTLRIVGDVGRRAVEHRNRWLAKARAATANGDGPLAGRRVIVGTDGGRIRTRKVKRGRRNAKTGHHRYDAPWREPKLLVIYAIDAKGDVCDEFRPVYDATLGDCDALFDMLAGYLKALGAHEASDLNVVADGAKWIWERAPLLAERVGIDLERLTEVVDWYHAVEKLHEVAAIPSGWTDRDRKRWLKRAKKHLHAGRIDRLMKLFDELAVGRHAQAIRDHEDYFRCNERRMQYSAFVAAKIPIGSGATESAIRRIVNLRMKGNGTFWKESNAEAMLLLRSYLKADRLDDLLDWSFSAAAPWWPPSDSQSTPLIGSQRAAA